MANLIKSVSLRIKRLYVFSLLMVLLIFVSCNSQTIQFMTVKSQKITAPPAIFLNDSIFNLLNKKWIFSFYFDRSMKYENSLFEVTSLSSLLNKYNLNDEVNAILLLCADDYQGMISFVDIKRYDLQLALRIKLSKEQSQPDWLEPLLIVVPNNVKAPLLERFLTANIKELRFVSLASYYAPIESLNLTSDVSKAGLKTFKDNCIFCHSINNVGGNKGGSLVDKYALILDREKKRFTEAFLKKHGMDNEEKQNTKQFLTNNSLDAVLKFLQDVKVAL
jgi:hypothetical protein